MTCVTCEYEKETIGIAIDDKAICAQCLMEGFVSGKQFKLANELNEFILSYNRNKDHHDNACWIKICKPTP